RPRLPGPRGGSITGRVAGGSADVAGLERALPRPGGPAAAGAGKTSFRQARGGAARAGPGGEGDRAARLRARRRLARAGGRDRPAPRGRSGAESGEVTGRGLHTSPQREQGWLLLALRAGGYASLSFFAGAGSVRSNCTSKAVCGGN